MSERVVVAMSGGVDSSVAAALLLDEGFEVHGVTFRLFDDRSDLPADGCAGASAVRSAQDVAATLGVDHQVVTDTAAFTERVLRPAWEEYARGRTPNPCLVCNREVKFAALCRHADELGARWVATGHYVRLERSDDLRLRRGLDPAKDQSYFLALLAPKQLARARFPLGHLTKVEVRDRARALGLSSAERAESQDACFAAGEGHFAEALRVHFDAPAQPGQLVDPAGKVLGEHAGVHHFTRGQRKGLNVALGRRAYVAAIHADRQEVVITDDPDQLETRALTVDGLQWHAPPADRDCLVQIRYRSPAVAARVRLEGEVAHVTLDEPVRAVTPGQAAVFYDGDVVLGGGWIRSA